MKKACPVFVLLILLKGVSFSQTTGDSNLSQLAVEAKKSLAKGIAFFQTLAIEGGYVYYYSLDGNERWGERQTDARTIEVQPPGTPAVGMSFLRAYRATGDPDFFGSR